MSALWGELPAITDIENINISLDQEQLSGKLHCVEVEGPALHQPSTRHFPPVNESLPSEHFELDPLTHHTIQLVQYVRRLRNLINNARIQLHDLKTEEGEQPPIFPPTPPIPVYEGQPLKHQVQKPLPFVVKDIESEFSRGMGKTPPEIDAKTTRKLLRKSVAAICAHSGYDNLYCPIYLLWFSLLQATCQDITLNCVINIGCSDSILETLTDVCHEYMSQITKTLRRAVDTEAMTGDTGFPDVMERVFHEMGIGSTREIHDFYQNRLITYHQNMVKKCRQLQQEYDNMKNPDYKLEDSRSSRSKDEPFGDSSIHFPTLDSLDTEESGDTDSLQLDNLGLDMSQDQSTEEDSRWSHSVRTDNSRVNSFDGFEGQDDAQSTGTDVATTPAMSSEAGESIQDPGSVSGSDMMSPPSGVPPKKKRKP